MKKEIIPIEFEEGRYKAYDESLKQWNHSQQLAISGLDISDEIVEVHFSLQEVGGTAKRMLGTVTDGILRVDIPAFILEGPEWSSEYYNAYAWIYLSDEESAETVRKIEFTIEARPKPDEYVKPEEPDTFIEQIKKIMNETKEIAQSVRDDADNGEFNGEKGEKGDAGSIEFKIVNELPIENISESTMYLVPLSPGTEQNEFAEYIYVNGYWEYIGSASVDVNLSEYVKNTDYPTSARAGVIKTNIPYGTCTTIDGVLYIISATLEEINERKHSYKPITPSNLDYAVKKALSDCKLTDADAWTDEEKAKALELLGIVLCEFGTPIQGRVAVLGSGGQLSVGTPTMHNSATTKKYVDDLVGSVETILTELHAYAETLSGGEA